MESVKVGGLALVQHALTGSEGQDRVWKTLKEKGACLLAGRSYVSLELSCMPMTKGSPVGRWGDTQLTVLSELLPRRLFHCMPNLSW
jgi:hypothetical protein